MKNAATTTSLGGTIAIAVKRQRPEVAEASVVTIVVVIAEVVEANAVTIVVVTVEVAEANAVTIVVVTVEVAEANAVTIVVVTVEVDHRRVTDIIAEPAGTLQLQGSVEEPRVHHGKVKVGGHLAEVHGNLVVGALRRTSAGPVSAEISRGAFI